MTSHHQTPEELLRAVEASHEQYLRNLRSLHEALAGNVRQRQRSDSRASYAAPSPLIRPVSSPRLSPTIVYDATFAPPPPSISASDLRGRQDTSSTLLARPHIPPSLHSEYEVEYLPLLDLRPGDRVAHPGDVAGSSSPAAGNVRRHRPVDRVSWTDRQLLTHLKKAPFTGGAEMALRRILEKREEIDVDMDFRAFAAVDDEYVSSTLELYDVDTDGNATPVGKQMDRSTPGAPQVLAPSQIVDAATVWTALKEVHTGENTVGLMTILQEPTPLMLGALHLTMSPYFDTTELLNHLIMDTENKGKTKAYVSRAFAKDMPPSPAGDIYLRKRSFFFVFKYYTVVGEGLEPAHWQNYDKRPSDKRSMDHIDIAECSSVLALSLSGPPAGSVRVSKRKEGWQEGYIFDTFAPWHLLNIQSFPDDEHTVRSDLSSTTGAATAKRHFVNGPYAFLDALAAEYRDATKRNQALHERITKLITPPTDFMFDGRLRDKLLFEDKHFTYIRRYFWAYNSLGVINAGIRSMLSSYRESFTDEFWEGKHSTLWPHPDPDGPEGRLYRDRMALVRTELDRACTDLEGVIARNTATRKEIENLRDQLFSGSSIRESRRAIEQGDNIKVLTLSSMVFLPLTFVTSVFGITDFDIPPTDWRFALTMICVCVPFILLLILLQTRAGYSMFKRLSEMIRDYGAMVLRSCAAWMSPASAPDGKGGPDSPGRPSASGMGQRVSTLTGEEKPRRKRRLTVRRTPASDGKAEAEEGWTSWGPWRWRRGKKGAVIEIRTVDGGKDNPV